MIELYEQTKAMLRYWLRPLILLALLCGWYTHAQAFIGAQAGKRQLAITKKGVYSGSIEVKAEGANTADLKRLRGDGVTGWRGLWNPWGTVHRLYAGGITDQTRLKGDVISADEMEGIAEDLIREYQSFFKVAPDDLVLKSVMFRGGIYYCRFQQFYKGIEVYGGGVQLRFDRKGEIILIGGDTYPEIMLSTVPSVSAEEATRIAKKEAGAIGEDQKGDRTMLYVLPLPHGDDIEYCLSWQVEVSGEAPGECALIFIDAHTGTVIVIYQLDREAIEGRVGGLILPKFFNDAPEWVPFSDQKVFLLNRSTPVCDTTLDEDPGWEREGMWEFGTPVPQGINSYGHAGCPDPDNGYTGQKVFGYNLNGDYTNLMRPKYLSTTPLNCQNKTGVTLKFWRWLGVQRENWTDPQTGLTTNYDRATIEVSNDYGKTWTVVWSNRTSQIEDGTYDAFNQMWKGWNLQFYDISDIADGKEVIIRWGMGATDGSGTFCGWNLDDIGVYESLNTKTDQEGFFSFPNTDDVPDNMLVCQLNGKYVTVENEDGSSAIYSLNNVAPNPPEPIALNWNINKTSLRDFDEFNAFYHINLLISYIKQIDPLYDAMEKKGPVTAIVRYGDNFKNAVWSPSENKIYFGEGDSCPGGYRNYALFSDIIYHEYTHAITDSFYSFFMPPLTAIRKTEDGESTGPVFVTEFDAMHEAFSDYWACTMNEDPEVGDGDLWIGHRYVRNLDNKFKYPDDYGDDPYANSLILSGAMWETRELLGEEVANTLFHFARYGGATTFDDLLVDILLQDEITYDGEHVEIIKGVFGSRGISRAPTAPSGIVGIAGNTYIDLEWRSNPDIDEVAGYYVYFRTENDIVTDKEDPSVRRDAGLSTTYRLDGVTNGTTYVLKVAAYNIYRAESEASDYVYATPYVESAQSSLGSERKVFCFIECLFDR